MGFDRGRRGGGVGTGAVDTQTAPAPGKRTLTEGLPVRRKVASGPIEPIAESEPAIARAGGSAGAPVAGEIRRKVQDTTGADLGGAYPYRR